MLDVTAEGFSSIVPVENAEGKQVGDRNTFSMLTIVIVKVTIQTKVGDKFYQTIDSK